MRIAESCHSDWRFSDTIFPAFRRLTDHEAFLDTQRRNLCRRAGTLWSAVGEVRARIEKELAVIRENTSRIIF